MTFPQLTLSASTIALIGKGAISAVRHMPAPKSGSLFYRWMFDTAQDLCGNNDRIGQNRDDLGIPRLRRPL